MKNTIKNVANVKMLPIAKSNTNPPTPRLWRKNWKLATLAMATLAILATFTAGCSVTKINYEKNDKGEVSYRLYRNDHWLKTDASGLRGGMTEDGKFEFAAEGLKSSPSEEFNRTMQTYTTAFVQLAQIAAAAYNPSASQAVSTAAKSASGASATPTVVVNTQAAEAASAKASAVANAKADKPASSSQTAADCPDCVDKPQSSTAEAK